MKEKKNTIAVMIRLTTGYHRYAFMLLMVMVVAALSEALGLGMILPVLSGLMNSQADYGAMGPVFEVIFSIFPGGDQAMVQLGILATAFLFKNLLAIALRGLNAHFTYTLRELWSCKLMYRYLRLDYARALESKQGVLFHNSIAEPSRVSKSFLVLLNLLTKLTLGLVIAAVLLLTDWKVTLILAFVALTVFAIINKVLSAYSLRFGENRLEVNQRASFLGAEGLGAIKEIKVQGLEDRYRNLLREQLILYRKINTKFAMVNHLPENLIEILAVFSVVAVIGYVHITGTIETTTVLAKIGFFVLAGQKMFSCVSYVLSQRMKFVSTIPGMLVIDEIIHQPEEMEELEKGETFGVLDKSLCLDGVSFSYGPGKEVLRDFSMEAPARKMTAIIGPSGSGKSTIADLILGLHHPESGTIKVDGKDLADYSLGSWRTKTGYVGQDPVIFNTTIRENILAGCPGATTQEVEEAARIANIHDFIVTLPQGYDTVVGDRGSKLSGGQRQRIVIARTVIRNPEIFIFDEATSALDRQTEAQITTAIENLAGDKTIVVIAHRLSTIKNADVVYDLGNQTETEMREEPGP